MHFAILQRGTAGLSVNSLKNKQTTHLQLLLAVSPPAGLGVQGGLENTTDKHTHTCGSWVSGSSASLPSYRNHGPEGEVKHVDAARCSGTGKGKDAMRTCRPESGCHTRPQARAGGTVLLRKYSILSMDTI